MIGAIRVVCSHQRKAPGREPLHVATLIREGPGDWTSLLVELIEIPLDYPEGADAEWAYEQIRRGAATYFKHPLRCAICKYEGRARLDTLAPLLDRLAALNCSRVELRVVIEGIRKLSLDDTPT